LINDLTDAAVNFAQGVATEFGELFARILVDGQNVFASLGQFVRAVGQFIKQLIRDLIVAIARAIALKVILSAAGLPFLESGGEVVGGQRGFSITGRGGPDTTLAALGSGETVLPTVGGLVPADLLRGLFDLKERIEDGIGDGGGDGRGTTIIQQTFEISAMNVDSVREEFRSGTVRREQARVLELRR
jgi:hypothetical protein